MSGRIFIFLPLYVITHHLGWNELDIGYYMMAIIELPYNDIFCLVAHILL